MERPKFWEKTQKKLSNMAKMFLHSNEVLLDTQIHIERSILKKCMYMSPDMTSWVM